jgi:hypothetical protein
MLRKPHIDLFRDALCLCLRLTLKVAMMCRNADAALITPTRFSIQVLGLLYKSQSSASGLLSFKIVTKMSQAEASKTNNAGEGAAKGRLIVQKGNFDNKVNPIGTKRVRLHFNVKKAQVGEHYHAHLSPSR